MPCLPATYEDFSHHLYFDILIFEIKMPKPHLLW